MPLRTRYYVGFTLLAAAATTFWSMHTPSSSWLIFLLFLAAVLVSSGLKVALPRGDGGMSLNFPFILLAVVQLSPAQAMLLAAISIAAQCRLRVRKIFTAVQIVFNIASSVTATAAACATFRLLTHFRLAMPPALALAAVSYFVVSTGTVALVIASSTDESPFKLWKKEFPWYLPFYFVGAVLAAATDLISGKFGWSTSLLMIPMVYTVFRAYNAQMARLKERALHLEQTQALHQRTIEGLSMAIEAKDQNTHDHLFRVRNYVAELGKKLGLGELEMQALHTAAFLHDIGKLAVPENIINKPGKLTPEEFEKMKIHPIVGADILERVRFPYPVVPIVRSHHEWWDGTGYPDGLKGDQIPIGARVLSAADCFDALISDRPYRKSMSVTDALALIKNMSGTQFDPAVITVLETLYTRLERETILVDTSTFTALNTEIEVRRGEAPAAGFEQDEASLTPTALGTEALSTLYAEGDNSDRIGDAMEEAQAIYKLTTSLGSHLTLSELASIISSRIARLIPFNTAALYLSAGDSLQLRYVDGERAADFSREPIPFGEGISGWVAETGKPILNGSAALEVGYVARAKSELLRSALSVPLLDRERNVFGVLTLYSTAPDSFRRDHLRMLFAMGPRLTQSLQHPLLSGEADAETTSDPLTNLPNARGLYAHLRPRLQECARTNGNLFLVLCDATRVRHSSLAQADPLATNSFLRLVADDLQHSALPGETIAHLGCGEFVFVLPDDEDHSLPNRMAQISSILEDTAQAASFASSTSTHFGVASFPIDGKSVEDLFAAAERRLFGDKDASNHVLPFPSAASPHDSGSFASAIAV